MFSSRKYFLDEIALFANSNEALYHDVFKPIIDNGKLWNNYEVWEAAAQVAIINYIKVNFQWSQSRQMLWQKNSFLKMT